MPARILVVDDEIEIIDALKILLEKSGYDVFSISKSPDIYTVLSTPQRIDLIILDLDMPLISGVDIMSEFKKYLENKNIPIILYSAAYDKGKEDLLLDAVSQKPYKFINKGDTEKLLKNIEEALKKYSEKNLLSESELDELYKLEAHYRDNPRNESDPQYHRYMELYYKNTGDEKQAKEHAQKRKKIT